MKNWITAAALCLAACSNTAVLSTWKKPGIGPMHFDKVAVIAPASDRSTRRSIEDRVAAKLTKVTAVPSYTVLDELPPDKQVVRNDLVTKGFDGAIVVRIASVDREATWVPGPSYVGMGTGPWPTYTAGYSAVETYVRVETDIYSLTEGELIFSAASRTANPSNLNDLLDETVEELADELEKQGLTSSSTSPAASF